MWISGTKWQRYRPPPLYFFQKTQATVRLLAPVCRKGGCLASLPDRAQKRESPIGLPVEVMDTDFVRKRITQLRMEKGVSEYQMSLDMGHSRSYIQSIVSGKSLPSMTEFLYMCEYLGVTPSAFFDEQMKNPALLQKAIDEMQSLPDKDILSLLSLIERFKEKMTKNGAQFILLCPVLIQPGFVAFAKRKEPL